MSESTLAIALPVGLNPSSLYLLWLSLGGDPVLTAAVAHVRVEIIQSLEYDFQWKALAGGKLGVKDTKIEQDVNRAQNFVQAQRLRRLVDAAINELEHPDQLRASLVEEGRDPSAAIKITAKPLVELAKAAEAIHNLSYRALGDTVARNADAVSDETEKIKRLAIDIGRAATHAATLSASRTDQVVKDARAITLEPV
jgi:hypothetical protein